MSNDVFSDIESEIFNRESVYIPIEEKGEKKKEYKEKKQARRNLFDIYEPDFWHTVEVHPVEEDDLVSFGFTRDEIEKFTKKVTFEEAEQKDIKEVEEEKIDELLEENDENINHKPEIELRKEDEKLGEEGKESC